MDQATPWILCLMLYSVVSVYVLCMHTACFQIGRVALEFRHSWTKFNPPMLIARDRQPAMQLLILLTSTNLCQYCCSCTLFSLLHKPATKYTGNIYKYAAYTRHFYCCHS